jgi:hypothetical protein
VLYLDHASIKLVCRRLEIIKDKLNMNTLDFMRTSPKAFADHILSADGSSEKIHVVNNSVNSLSIDPSA